MPWKRHARQRKNLPMNTNERPTDLMGLKDAAKLVPSPFGGGRGVHLCTFRRWVLAGKLRYWRVGKWLMVSRADVMGLFEPVEKVDPTPILSMTQEAAEVILKRHRL